VNTEPPFAAAVDVESPSRGGEVIEDVDLRAAPSEDKRALPPKMKVAITCLAITLCVLTFLEDAHRAVTMWKEQTTFIAQHMGVAYAVASAVLFVIVCVQISSVMMVVPPSPTRPGAAKVVCGVCVAAAISVALQPLLFNQLSNAELLQLTCAQLGALGTIFCEAHAVGFPRRKPFADFCATATARVEEQVAAVVPWLQLGSRVLLTVDLTCVFLSRLLAFDGSLGSPHPRIALDVLLLVAGIFIWLGLKTQPLACAVALYTFCDSFVRFPFFLGGPKADFRKFFFFQAMTTVGGLLLLALHGPGKLSIDAKKLK